MSEESKSRKKSGYVPKKIIENLEDYLNEMNRIARRLNMNSLSNDRFNKLNEFVNKIFNDYPDSVTMNYPESDSKVDYETYSSRYEDIMFITRTVEDRVEELKRKGIIDGDKIASGKYSRDCQKTREIPYPISEAIFYQTKEDFS